MNAHEAASTSNVALHGWNPIADSADADLLPLMMVEADRLATPLGLEHRDDIRKGIELDRWGAPVAYHILKRHPGHVFAFGFYGMTREAQLMEWDRIPAFAAWGRRRVIHLHDKERTGQSRGKPLVTAVMREFHMAGKYAANELQASLANSLVAAFLESDRGLNAAHPSARRHHCRPERRLLGAMPRMVASAHGVPKLAPELLSTRRGEQTHRG